jgi:hypothetical protein
MPNDDKMYTGQAAKILAGSIEGQGGRVGVFPFELLFAFLLQAIPMLSNLCAPTPQQGYQYLTWKPKVWIWGIWSYRSQLERFRNGVEVSARRAWTGTAADFRDTMAAMWDAIDAGKLSPAMMNGLYSEAGL